MTPVAALLHDAINWLAVDAEDNRSETGRRRFSCDAVHSAYRTGHSIDAYVHARALLKELGCDLTGADCYKEFETPGCFWARSVTPESQQARALWLTWAAMIAEEEGI